MREPAVVLELVDHPFEAQLRLAALPICHAAGREDCKAVESRYSQGGARRVANG